MSPRAKHNGGSPSHEDASFFKSYILKLQVCVCVRKMCLLCADLLFTDHELIHVVRVSFEKAFDDFGLLLFLCTPHQKCFIFQLNKEIMVPTIHTYKSLISVQVTLF